MASSADGSSTNGGCFSIFMYVAVALIVLAVVSPNTFSCSRNASSSNSAKPSNAELAGQVMHGDARVVTDNKGLNLVVGQDIPAGTYLFYPIDGWNASGWANIQYQGNVGAGGGYVSGWTTMPVREGQVLQVSHVHFCLVDNCDLSAIEGPIKEFPGRSDSPAKPSSPSYGSSKYDAVCAAAETIKEQYPGISWSSQWEELHNMGYSNEEIAWAIGG